MDKFCGKCGAPLGGGKFCPNCGAQVVGAPSPTPDKAGRLLVSTQSSRTALKSFQIVFLTLYYVIVLILLLMIFTHWSEYMIRTGLIGLDLFDSIDIGHFLGFAVIPLLLCLPIASIRSVIVTFCQDKSYLNVYESHLEGVTALSYTEAMTKFRLHYREILNVAESGQHIVIYTSYATYEVLAKNNRVEALREISRRLPHRPEEPSSAASNTYN